MAAIAQNVTSEQLLQTPGLEHCELLRGELVIMSPAGFEHGLIAHRVSLLLGEFLRGKSLDVVVVAEAGFQIARNPDTVRAPDVAFVGAERVRGGNTSGFFEGAPDLAVEVLSPHDRAGEVFAKVKDWIAAGCKAVWVVDPQTQTVTVYRGGGEASILNATDALTGGDLLPGFSVAVAEIFGS
jgi:Uma2 family endonuclease